MLMTSYISFSICPSVDNILALDCSVDDHTLYVRLSTDGQKCSALK